MGGVVGLQQECALYRMAAIHLSDRVVAFRKPRERSTLVRAVATVFIMVKRGEKLIVPANQRWKVSVD